MKLNYINVIIIENIPYFSILRTKQTNLYINYQYLNYKDLIKIEQICAFIWLTYLSLQAFFSAADSRNNGNTHRRNNDTHWGKVVLTNGKLLIEKNLKGDDHRNPDFLT